MNNKSSRMIVALSAGALALGCATLTGGIETTVPQAVPTATPSVSVDVLTDEQIMAGIQASLDVLARAYAENDVELLSEVLDLENKAFSRFVRTRFTTDQQSYDGAGIEDSYVVEYIRQRDYNLVMAHIIYDEIAAVDWIFRELDDGRWVLTEPTVEQTGQLIIRDTDHFEFRTYPWADDVNMRVEALMQNARDRVEDKLGKVPEEKIEVEIIPTYGLYPFDDPNALAYYSYEGSFTGDGDRMVIYAPNSYLFSWYYLDEGWQAELEDVLTHEYTHMTHARSFEYAGRLSDWIVEGLAEYVDGVDRAHNVEYALESGTMIPLTDTREGIVYKQDLAHIYLLETDVSLAYAEAESLVAFIVEENGGFDAFWSFAQAYTDEGGNLDQALQGSLNMTQSQFEAAWKAWLIETYLPVHAN